MAIPPPLDPVLLREHAYYDTKLLKLVFSNDHVPGFLPLHVRGLGSFNYQFTESFPFAFSYRGIDINNKDPNVDTLANGHGGNSDSNINGDELGLGMIISFLFVLIIAGGLTYVLGSTISTFIIRGQDKLKRRSSNAASSFSYYSNNEKELKLEKDQLYHDYPNSNRSRSRSSSNDAAPSFEAADFLENGFIASEQEQQFYAPNNFNARSPVPSLINTPIVSHQRTESLDTIVQTPASSADFVFERIQNGGNNAIKGLGINQGHHLPPPHHQQQQQQQQPLYTLP